MELRRKSRSKGTRIRLIFQLLALFLQATHCKEAYNDIMDYPQKCNFTKLMCNESRLLEEDKIIILNIANEMRNRVAAGSFKYLNLQHDPVSNMNKLSWSQELEKKAASIVSSCPETNPSFISQETSILPGMDGIDYIEINSTIDPSTYKQIDDKISGCEVSTITYKEKLTLCAPQKIKERLIGYLTEGGLSTEARKYDLRDFWIVTRFGEPRLTFRRPESTQIGCSYLIRAGKMHYFSYLTCIHCAYNTTLPLIGHPGEECDESSQHYDEKYENLCTDLRNEYENIAKDQNLVVCKSAEKYIADDKATTVPLNDSSGGKTTTRTGNNKGTNAETSRMSITSSQSLIEDSTTDSFCDTRHFETPASVHSTTGSISSESSLSPTIHDSQRPSDGSTISKFVKSTYRKTTPTSRTEHSNLTTILRPSTTLNEFLSTRNMSFTTSLIDFTTYGETIRTLELNTTTSTPTLTGMETRTLVTTVSPQIEDISKMPVTTVSPQMEDISKMPSSAEEFSMTHSASTITFHSIQSLTTKQFTDKLQNITAPATIPTREKFTAFSITDISTMISPTTEIHTTIRPITTTCRKTTKFSNTTHSASTVKFHSTIQTSTSSKDTTIVLPATKVNTTIRPVTTMCRKTTKIRNTTYSSPAITSQSTTQTSTSTKDIGIVSPATKVNITIHPFTTTCRKTSKLSNTKHSESIVTSSHSTIRTPMTNQLNTTTTTPSSTTTFSTMAESHNYTAPTTTPTQEMSTVTSVQDLSSVVSLKTKVNSTLRQVTTTCRKTTKLLNATYSASTATPSLLTTQMLTSTDISMLPFTAEVTTAPRPIKTTCRKTTKHANTTHSASTIAPSLSTALTTSSTRDISIVPSTTGATTKPRPIRTTCRKTTKLSNTTYSTPSTVVPSLTTTQILTSTKDIIIVPTTTEVTTTPRPVETTSRKTTKLLNTTHSASTTMPSIPTTKQLDVSKTTPKSTMTFATTVKLSSYTIPSTTSTQEKSNSTLIKDLSHMTSLTTKTNITLHPFTTATFSMPSVTSLPLTTQTPTTQKLNITVTVIIPTTTKSTFFSTAESQTFTAPITSTHQKSTVTFIQDISKTEPPVTKLNITLHPVITTHRKTTELLNTAPYNSTTQKPSTEQLNTTLTTMRTMSILTTKLHSTATTTKPTTTTTTTTPTFTTMRTTSLSTIKSHSTAPTTRPATTTTTPMFTTRSTSLSTAPTTLHTTKQTTTSYKKPVSKIESTSATFEETLHPVVKSTTQTTSPNTTYSISAMTSHFTSQIPSSKKINVTVTTPASTTTVICEKDISTMTSPMIKFNTTIRPRKSTCRKTIRTTTQRYSTTQTPTIKKLHTTTTTPIPTTTRTTFSITVEPHQHTTPTAIPIHQKSTATFIEDILKVDSPTSQVNATITTTSRKAVPSLSTASLITTKRPNSTTTVKPQTYTVLSTSSVAQKSTATFATKIKTKKLPKIKATTSYPFTTTSRKETVSRNTFFARIIAPVSSTARNISSTLCDITFHPITTTSRKTTTASHYTSTTQSITSMHSTASIKTSSGAVPSTTTSKKPTVKLTTLQPKTFNEISSTISTSVTTKTLPTTVTLKNTFISTTRRNRTSAQSLKIIPPFSEISRSSTKSLNITSPETKPNTIRFSTTISQQTEASTIGVSTTKITTLQPKTSKKTTFTTWIIPTTFVKPNNITFIPTSNEILTISGIESQKITSPETKASTTGFSTSKSTTVTTFSPRTTATATFSAKSHIPTFTQSSVIPDKMTVPITNSTLHNITHTTPQSTKFCKSTDGMMTSTTRNLITILNLTKFNATRLQPTTLQSTRKNTKTIATSSTYSAIHNKTKSTLGTIFTKIQPSSHTTHKPTTISILMQSKLSTRKAIPSITATIKPPSPTHGSTEASHSTFFTTSLIELINFTSKPTQHTTESISTPGATTFSGTFAAFCKSITTSVRVPKIAQSFKTTSSSPVTSAPTQKITVQTSSRSKSSNGTIAKQTENSILPWTITHPTSPKTILSWFRKSTRPETSSESTFSTSMCNPCKNRDKENIAHMKFDIEIPETPSTSSSSLISTTSTSSVFTLISSPKTKSNESSSEPENTTSATFNFTYTDHKQRPCICINWFVMALIFSVAFLFAWCLLCWQRVLLF